MRSLTDEPPAESSRIRLAFSEPLPGTRSSDVSSLSKIPWPPTPPIASAADVIVSASHTAMTISGCLVVRRPRAANTYKLSHSLVTAGLQSNCWLWETSKRAAEATPSKCMFGAPKSTLRTRTLMDKLVAGVRSLLITNT